MGSGASSSPSNASLDTKVNSKYSRSALRKSLTAGENQIIVIRELNDVASNREARQRFQHAISLYPPGTLSRWDKIYDDINKEYENSLLRLELSMQTIKNCYKLFYDETTTILSKGFTYMRNHLSKIYDKHNLNKVIKISQNERNQRELTDECYCYGELDHEIFATIYIKFIKTYGERTNGTFYDLGCGVGINVYAAAFIGNFIKCVGIEYIDALLERGEKRLVRWNNTIKGLLDINYKNIEITWELENLFLDSFWIDGTFYLLHWTSFSNLQKQKISEIMEECRIGTIVITITSPLQNSSYEILIKDKCETSWGLSDYYIHEKVN